MNKAKKNLINKDAKIQSRREMMDNLQPPIAANDQNVIIENDGDWLNIRIKKDYLSRSTNFDIQKAIAIATSPFFTNDNKQPDLSAVKTTKKIFKSFPRVGFFVESAGHYTGGRYSTFMYALLLSGYTDVTWVTNERPIFEGDFQDYDQDKFKVVVDKHFLLQSQECEFDVVIGTPVVGGSYARSYAEKYKCKLVSIIFETPNWISKYRDGLDADETFWKGYKEILYMSDFIIVPSSESFKHLYKWLDEPRKTNTIYVVNPPINELVLRKAKQTSLDIKIKGCKKQIVYCTRMADFKNPCAIIKRLSKDIGVHIIGKVWEEKQFEGMENVVLHGAINDRKKFKIISSCDAMLFPTTFEGAGMPPAEALACGVPVVTNDLPVLKEIYGGHAYYVKDNDPERYISVLRSILNDPPNMSGHKMPDGMKMSEVSNNLHKIFDLPTITAGIICYNCREYLEYAIKSIYPVVNKIVLVCGRVQHYPVYKDEGKEHNWILDKIKEIDYLNKIELVSNDDWLDKIAMQNEIAKRVDTDYYVKVDADEIWNPRTLMEVVSYLEDNPKTKYICMPFLHFWTNFKTVAKDAGGKWGTKHPRVWRWSKGMYHFKSFNYFHNNTNDKLPVKSPHFKGEDWNGEPIYHFGWARPLKNAQAKIKYYASRGIEEYVKDNYSTWKKLSDQTMCTQPVRSWAEPYDGKLPKIMTEHPWYGVEDVRDFEIIKEFVT